MKHSLLLSFLLFCFAISWAQDPPINDSCEDAIDIDGLFHLGTPEVQMSDVFTNVGATVGDDDPFFGLDCWLEIKFGEGDDIEPRDKTVWFSFIGDGEEYNIKTSNCNGELTKSYITEGDTQMAVFIGECGNLTEAVACNEDSPSIDWDTGPDEQGWFAEVDVLTEDGVEYFVYIDGLNWSIFDEKDPIGAVEGDFCIEVTQFFVDVDDVIEDDFLMYPVPAQDVLNLQYTRSIVGQVMIMDATGRVCLNQRIANNKQIDVSSLSPGFYELSIIESDGNVLTKEFIKD